MAIIRDVKCSLRNPVIIGVLIAFIVMGIIAVKVASKPAGLQGQLKTESTMSSEEPRLQDSREIEDPFLPGNDVLDKLRSLRSPALERDVLEIARTSVTRVVENREAKSREADSPQPVSDRLLHMQAGVFVTLIIDDRVRGCMGRIYPAEPNLRDEIAKAAEMAATMDIRHSPISLEDLPKIDYCVSVVGRVRRERPDAEVNPRLEGVLVKTGERSGVILPGEAKTADYQRKWAKREAGIEPGVPFELYVFETERFGKTLPVRG